MRYIITGALDYELDVLAQMSVGDRAGILRRRLTP